MMKWIGAAVVAGALALAAPAVAATSGEPGATEQQRQADKATDFSAQRYHRHTHRRSYYGYRPHDRPHYYYYGRPTYYRPYPYAVPAPFTFGFGFGPFW